MINQVRQKSMNQKHDPFSRLLSIQENFENTFATIEDYKPINELILLFQKNYEEIINVISTLSDLGKLIFLRYIDERGKDEDRIKTDHKLNVEMNAKISNILRLELSFAMLLKIYNEVSKHNLGTKVNENIIQNSINVESLFGFLNSLYFNDEDPSKFLSHLTPYLKEINQINQKQRTVQILNRIKTKHQGNSAANIELFDLEGQFFLHSLKPYFEQIQKQWWLEDPVTEYFIQALGIENLDLVVKSWDQNPHHEFASRIEQIKSSQLQIGEIIRDLLKSKLMFKMAIQSLKNGNHEVAKEYLDSCSNIEKIYVLAREYPELIDRKTNKEITQYYQTIMITSKIVQIQKKFENLMKVIVNKQDIMAISEVISEINSEFDLTNLQMDLPYLSAIPALYQSLVSMLELMISLNKDESEMLDKFDEIFRGYTNRVEVAVNQLNSSINSLANESDPDNLKEVIADSLEKSQTLELAILLLPLNIRTSTNLAERLSCISNLCLSINYEIKALETEDEDKLHELIYKTWAFHFAKNSFLVAKQLDHALIPIQRIMAHYSGSFISSHTIQMHIYQLTLQYMCLSHVIPTLFFTIALDENVFSSNNEVISNLQDIINSIDPFIEMLNQISQDCQSLLDHKSEMGSVLQQVKWEKIDFRKQLIEGIVTFFQSIRYAIIGVWSSQLGLLDQSTLNLNDAITTSFKAAEFLQAENDQILSEFSKHVFSFGQLCQGLSQNISKVELVDLAPQSLFKLFRDMVFAI